MFFDSGVLNMCNIPPKGNVDLGLHDFQTIPFRASVDPHMLLLVDSNNPIFATAATMISRLTLVGSQAAEFPSHQM